MNYVLENLTRRPVSIICNSGKSYHLPPRHIVEFPDIEVKDNAMLAKLQSRHVLSLKKADDKRRSATTTKKAQNKRAKSKSKT